MNPNYDISKLPLFVQKEIEEKRKRELLAREQARQLEESKKKFEDYWKTLTQEEIQTPYGKPPSDWEKISRAWND